MTTTNLKKIKNNISKEKIRYIDVDLNLQIKLAHGQNWESIITALGQLYGQTNIASVNKLIIYLQDIIYEEIK